MITIKNSALLNELTVGNSVKLEYTAKPAVKTVLFFESPTQSDYVKVEMDGTVKLLKETTETLVVNYAGLDEKDEKITEGKVEFTRKQPEPVVKEEPKEKPAPKEPEQTKAEPKKEEPAAPKKAAPKRTRKATAKKAEEPAKEVEETTSEETPVAQPFEGTAQNVNKHYLYRRSPGSKLK